MTKQLATWAATAFAASFLCALGYDSAPTEGLKNWFGMMSGVSGFAALGLAAITLGIWFEKR